MFNNKFFICFQFYDDKTGKTSKQLKAQFLLPLFISIQILENSFMNLDRLLT